MALYTLNIAEWTIASYAAALADLVLVNINPAYQAEELEWTLNEVECQALITADTFKVGNYEKIIAQIAPEVAESTPGNVNIQRLPHLKNLIMISDQEHKGYHKFDDLYGKTSSDYAERTANVDYMSCYNI